MDARSRLQRPERPTTRLVTSILATFAAAALLVVLTARYGDSIGRTAPTPDGSTGDATAAGDGTLTSAAARDCSPRSPAAAEPISATDPAKILVELTRRSYVCADRVVVSGPEPAARWTAAEIAMSDGAVFLAVSPSSGTQLVAELTRLEPNGVTVVGVDPATAEDLTGDWELIELPVDPAARPPTPPSDGDSLWVLGGVDPELAATLTPLAAQSRVGILDLGRSAAGTPDLFSLTASLNDRLRAADAVQLVGPFDDTDTWRMAAIRSGVELHGGGLTVLPDKRSTDRSAVDRRYVAFYGTPGTSALGVLGEQDPAATLERMRPLLADYETDDGVVVVPTFELIATVAAAEPGADGDYSNETAVDTLRPYVDFAAANGVYVLLDLQPGRTDFLTQAKRYEELLVQPHVGLALDPEWRLAPNQRHLRQLGSVDAAEINEVSAWLAELVRDHALPQKMLLIHQFKLSMITNRSAIEHRPELSMVIQMDGQGPLGTKYSTLAALVQGTENSHWHWGWKNFYDEDSPMASPAQTLAVDPQPVFVSYQ